MTPDEFMQNLNTAIDQTAEDMKPVMEEAALSGKGMLRRRVHDEGFGRKYTSRGYIRIRDLRGFEIRFVNLTFTGAMMREWNVPNSYRDGLIVGGGVSGLNKETQDKLRWNKSRYPTFDQANEEERQIIKDKLVTPRLAEILKKNLFK